MAELHTSGSTQEKDGRADDHSRPSVGVARFGRAKDPVKVRIDRRICELWDAGHTNDQICQRLDEQPDKYPSRWEGKTWTQRRNEKPHAMKSYLRKIHTTLT